MTFTIALELSVDEAKDLLRSAGFALSGCSKTDIIVAFFSRIRFTICLKSTMFCTLMVKVICKADGAGKEGSLCICWWILRMLEAAGCGAWIIWKRAIISRYFSVMRLVNVRTGRMAARQS